MFKRIILFLVTNLAVMIVLSIILFILEYFLGIHLTGYWYLFVVALVIGFGGSFISLLMSKWIAKKAYKITLINQSNLSELDSKEKAVWDIVVELAEANHIKMPEVGIYSDTDPNAFATGATKNSSLVAVSTGLLTAMNKNEIEGVIGHEMSHILNGDMVTMTLLQGVLNTFVIFLSRVIGNLISQAVDEKFSILAYYLSIILLEILFGILASLVVMGFSRHREYKADEGSAKFVGKEKMIAGLRSLQKMQNLASDDKGSFASMKISTKQKGGIMKYFASHPDLESRIMNLENKNF